MTKRTMLLLPILSILTMAAAPPSAPYPRVNERAKMLAAIADIKEQKLDLGDLSKATPEAKKFLEIYRDEMWPVEQKVSTVLQGRNLYSVAFDRALYNDETEKAAWQKAVVDGANEYNQIVSSAKYKDLLKRMAEAAKGLKGDLPAAARREYEDDQRSGFTEAELPLTKRASELSASIQKIANDSPLAEKLSQSDRESQDIEAKFVAGTLAFDEATKQLEALAPISREAYGQDIATRGRKLFTELAIIRTKLAKTKGYRNWAEYQVASNDRLFAPGFKTVGERISFLRDVLSSTYGVHKAFYAKRAKQLKGVPADILTDIHNMRVNQGVLFRMPTAAPVLEYFPIANVEAVWRKAMTDSGFPVTALDNLTLDNYPRTGKQTHNYMAPVKSHAVKVFRVDPVTLNVSVPAADSGEWNAAKIYIVQNMRIDGPTNYRTAFHEGGHGLDYSYREDVLGLGQDSAYTETHSMTMEKFMVDRDYLLSIGQKTSGEKITPEQVDTFIENTAVNDLTFLRGQGTLSLYDLELWNHAYEEGGEEFVDRALRIAEEISSQYMVAKQGKLVAGIDYRYGRFSTGHFYGGSVRYIGYIYASMAASMSHARLLDLLEQKTKRRTLLNQPEIAPILIEGYYKNGFALPFPLGTEHFAQKKFDAKEIARLISENVEAWTKKP